MTNPLEAPCAGNILVIDDHPDHLRALSAMLMKRGYRVRKALNGQMGLLAAQTLPPDLILLDVNMPELDGYEVCRLLKIDRQTCAIPIIFISALDRTEDILKGFAVGGVDYIAKPFKIAEVVARVSTHLTIQRLQAQLKTQNQYLHMQNLRLQQEIHDREQAESALKEANQKLQTLVCLDSLTGVANRRHFDGYFQQEWLRMAREKQPLALVLCDLDYFKLYNDTYGHLAGDVCLKLVAQAIARAVRRPGDEVFRYGGEEFAVILPSTDLAGAVQVAQNIQQEVQRLNLAHLRSPIGPHVTLSIGIASAIPQHTSSQEMLFAASDRALYQAKESGRNKYCLQTLIEQPTQRDS